MTITTDKQMKYIPRKKVLQNLSIGRKTIWLWEREGLNFIKVRGSIFYHADDLNAFLEKHRFNGRKVLQNG